MHEGSTLLFCFVLIIISFPVNKVSVFHLDFTFPFFQIHRSTERVHKHFWTSARGFFLLFIDFLIFNFCPLDILPLEQLLGSCGLLKCEILCVQVYSGRQFLVETGRKGINMREYTHTLKCIADVLKMCTFSLSHSSLPCTSRSQ